MADGFSYGGYYGAPYPYWLSPPFPYPPVSAPSFLTSNPVASYDPTQGLFDPMISQGPYQRSLAEWSNNPSYPENSLSGTPSSSLYANNNRPGNFCQTYGLYSSREPSSDFVSLPAENFSERPSLDFVPISSYEEAGMLMKNIQEPFFTPVTSSLDENYPGYYIPASDRSGSMNVVPGSHGGEPYTNSNPSLPMAISKTQALFGRSQTGIHIGDGRSFSSNSDVCSHAPEDLIGAQSSLHGSSIEPINFDALLAGGHIKHLPKNPDSAYQIVSSQGCRSPRSSTPIPSNIGSSISVVKDIEGSGVYSLYQRPCNLVADSKQGLSENFVRNAVQDLSCDEHRSWNHGMASSEGPSAPAIFSMGSESLGAMKADNENAKTAVKYKPPFEGRIFQPSEDIQANQKPCKLQEQMLDIMYGDNKTTLLTDMSVNGSLRLNEDDVSTGRSPERHSCDQGDFPSSSSSPRISSVINAMHNLSEVLVYECFNNGSLLKLDQLEYLDKVVDNLTKCLKKITGNRTLAGEASPPSQARHVSCPNVFNLNEAPKLVAKDFQGLNVKPLDSYDMKESVDKNEMTQGIKNILASNFLDGEENHPETLLYKNLWLETEAALCSTSAMARYHRIKSEIGNIKLHDREISADASASKQSPSIDPQTSVPIMNSENQETTETLIKQSSNCVENVVTMSTDTAQSSKVSDSVDAVLSLMCQNFMGGLEQSIHGNLSPDTSTSAKIPSAIQQEYPASTTEDKHTDVIDRFQILKQRETNWILDTQNYPETKIGEQEDSEALKTADVGRNNHVSDVMDRFQILKRREAEQAEKSLNGLDIDSDSDIDKPNSETEMRDHLWSGSLIKIRGNSQIETCAADTEPSASVKGCESPTSDWEHVLKDD